MFCESLPTLSGGGALGAASGATCLASSQAKNARKRRAS